MRAGVQQHQRVHLEAQAHGSARHRVRRVEGQAAPRTHRHTAEPIDVRRKVSPVQAVFRRFDQEAVMAILRAPVARRLIIHLSPSLSHQRARGGPAGGVVPAHRVLDDRAEDAAHVGIQAVALRQPKRVLAFQRVRRVVALEQVLRIV
jgi:hypothetical protein